MLLSKVVAPVRNGGFVIIATPHKVRMAVKTKKMPHGSPTRK